MASLLTQAQPLLFLPTLIKAIPLVLVIALPYLFNRGPIAKKRLFMKKTTGVISVLVAIFIATDLYAANAPIQRIDIANLLSNGGGISSTAVSLEFTNGGSTPCFTTTLPYQGVITVWAGMGQACTTAITNLTITPLAGDFGVIYNPPNPLTISNSPYLTQITISQNTAPTFDPTNGTLLSTGTVATTFLNKLTK